MKEEKKILVTWEVRDGFCGGSKPQYTTIEGFDIENLTDEGTIEAFENLSKDEQEKAVTDAVKDDFENNISWCEESRTELEGDELEVEWKVEDGYCGNGIHDLNICISDAEGTPIDTYIDECIKADFEEKVIFSIEKIEIQKGN